MINGTVRLNDQLDVWKSEIGDVALDAILRIRRQIFLTHGLVELLLYG